MGFFYIGDDETIEDTEHDGGVVVVVATGEIDYEAGPSLRELLVDHIKAGRRRVVLDLSTATFIDSTAIGVLMGSVVRMRDSGGGSLVIVCPEENERVRHIFEIAGVDGWIALHRSREDALSALTTAG